MRIILSLVLAACALQPARAAPTDGELMDMARETARLAAQHWNIAVAVKTAESNQILSHPSGQIRVPVRALRELIGDAPDENVSTLVAWVMAHEVWHQDQYRRGLTLAAADDVKRMSECEADMMAAHFLTDGSLREQQSAPSDAAAQELASAIMDIIAALQRLEAGFDGVLSHPTGDARLLAVRTGAGRAVQERLVDLASDAESRFVRDRMARIYDVRPNEAVSMWAERLCGLILHDGDGFADIARDTPSIQWNKSADSPVVDYALPYRNRGDRPIRVTMQVRSASVPRVNREDKTRWTYADAKLYQFDLQPGATYRVAGRLQWYASDASMPRLLYAPADGSMFNAILLAASTQTPAPQPIGGLPPELERLKGGLLTIYNDAPNRFRTVAPSCPSEDGDEYCPLRVQLPGIISGEGIRFGDGSSDVDLVIYRGNSEEAASTAYRDFREKLIRIYPAVTITQRPVTADREQIVMRPTARAELRLTKRKRNSGEYVVSAVITPELN